MPSLGRIIQPDVSAGQGHLNQPCKGSLCFCLGFPKLKKQHQFVCRKSLEHLKLEEQSLQWEGNKSLRQVVKQITRSGVESPDASLGIFKNYETHILNVEADATSEKSNRIYTHFRAMYTVLFKSSIIDFLRNMFKPVCLLYVSCSC